MSKLRRKKGPKIDKIKQEEIKVSFHYSLGERSHCASSVCAWGTGFRDERSSDVRARRRGPRRGGAGGFPEGNPAVIYTDPLFAFLTCSLHPAPGQAWEKHYQAERTWEDLEEDETGRLRITQGDKKYREKRRKIAMAAANSHVCKGMIRFLYVVVDPSQAVNEADMRPSRLAVVSGLLYTFFREFFNQNPLSQLGLVVTRNGIAERLTELSGSPESHIKALKENLEAAGDMVGSFSIP